MQDRALHRRARRQHDRQSKQRKAIRDKEEIQKGNDDKLRRRLRCKSVDITYPGAKEPTTHKVIRGKEGKLNNRRRPEGSLPPSGRQLINITMETIRQTAKILPVSHICLEKVSFDFQKLENEDIQAWEYGKGPLYGFATYKDYIRERQQGKCLLCGERGIEFFHHILPRKAGKNDHVSNIAGLCYECHFGKEGVHHCQEAADRLQELKAGGVQKYKVGLLNSVMPTLIEEVRAYCSSRGIRFMVTDGRATAKTREKYRLNKDHPLDAYAISLAGRDIKPEVILPGGMVYQKRRFKKKSKNIIAAENSRVYMLNGKIVAKNLHKAMDQKENSLFEFMEEYRKNPVQGMSPDQLFHKLTIIPARRTYTYRKRGLVSPLKAGDIARYRKHNKVKGTVKTEMFCVSSVKHQMTVRSKKGVTWQEREWIIEGYGGGTKKGKYCSPVKSGCLQTVGKEYIAIARGNSQERKLVFELVYQKIDILCYSRMDAYAAYLRKVI